VKKSIATESFTWLSKNARQDGDDEPGRPVRWLASSPGMRLRLIAAAGLVALLPATARAWIYPEHRDIAVAGFQKLASEDQAVLTRLWDEARVGYDGKLCPRPSEGEQGPRPDCIDLAAIPALAGDHSCSPREVVEKVLPGEWVLEVARVARETKSSLAATQDRFVKLNALARSNLQLQAADPEYVSRAGANNAHFLLPRASDDFDLYAISSVVEGAPLNALGLYLQYHLAALALAHEYATRALPPAERPAMARKILVTEGYALHWLQDIYSSGHEVGTWGSNAWRKGTHDYYSEFGLDHVTWGGEPIIVFGDANMKPADLRRTSDAVRAALEQLVAALRPGDELGSLAAGFGPGPEEIYAFDSCREEKQPVAHAASDLRRHFASQIRATPVAARGAGDVHVARFREELGPFIGGFATLTGALRWGGFGPEKPQFFGALAAGIRLGYGAESLTGSVGTGIAWLEAGIAMQSAQLYPCSGDPGCAVYGFFPIIPARTGLRVGMRLPFYVVPGDMLILGPVLALASPSALSAVGVAAASGGLIPYERGFNIGAGSLQVVAGRVVDATFFGYVQDAVIIVPIVPIPPDTGDLGVAQLKSVQLNFPVLEWTPFRTFATQLVFAAPVQLGFGVELPIYSPVVVPTGYPPASLGPSWSIFLRGSFEARYFFGSREDLTAPHR